MTEILYGQPVVEKIKQEVLEGVAKLLRTPTLAVVGFSSNLQWQQYVASLVKCAKDYTCAVECVNFCDDVEFEEFSNTILRLNSDKNIDGILVQQPLPKRLADVVNLVSDKKDVDGLTAKSLHCIFCNAENLVPATPLAVLKMLEFYNIDVTGKNVVILGRGAAVGKPLSLLLLNRNATVTVCHTRTQNIEKVSKTADILVSACGKADLVDESFVNENTIFLDVGLSFVDGKTKGDGNFDSLFGKVKAMSPVPKGIGPVTRACLFLNLLKATKR